MALDPQHVPEQLSVLARPRMQQSTLLLALSGWMDGGLVSTGTVKHLMAGHNVAPLASIDPDGFYIDSFPGSMEITALFRPRVKIVKGAVRELDLPTNEFFCDPAANLVFFIGKEPNLHWQRFADCIFHVAGLASVTRIIFMGSFGGSVPHTREPRLFGSVSDKKLRPLLKQHGLRPSDYEGPASFSNLLLVQSPRHAIEMLAIAAEIPGYLQGINPLSIEAVTRRLARIMALPVNMDSLREASNEWEAQVTEAVAKDSDLAETVRQLEDEYDNELIEEQG